MSAALKKILWAEMVVLLQRKSKWACLKRRKSIFCSSFQFKLIHYTQNKEHEKATLTRNSLQNHWAQRKRKHNWPLLWCNMKKLVSQKIDSVHFFSFFRTHDPWNQDWGVSREQWTESYEEYRVVSTIYIVKNWLHKQIKQYFSYQGEPRWTTSGWPASKFWLLICSLLD